MKNKDNIKYISMLIVSTLVSGLISVSANSNLFSSNEVIYENNKSGLTSTNVQGAVDELYAAATDYSNINGRVSTLETNYSNISQSNSTLQTKVTNLENNKQNNITGGASTITTSNLTANRALISNSSGKVAVSAVTSTELGYIDGVTSNVQTQLDSKMKCKYTGWTTSLTVENIRAPQLIVMVRQKLYYIWIASTADCTVHDVMTNTRYTATNGTTVAGTTTFKRSGQTLTITDTSNASITAFYY